MLFQKNVLALDISGSTVFGSTTQSRYYLPIARVASQMDGAALLVFLVYIPENIVSATTKENQDLAKPNSFAEKEGQPSR